MTGFTDKLQAYKQGQTTPGSAAYKEAVWRLMIACGTAIRDQDPDRYRPNYTNYYGGSIDGSVEETERVYRLMVKHGIDFEASSDPAEDHGSEFRGTFADHQGSYPFLGGWLAFGNGQGVYWAVKVGGDQEDFGRVVRAITALDLTTEDALEHLGARLDEDSDVYGNFAYGAELPEEL